MTVDGAIKHLLLLADGKEVKLEPRECIQIAEWLKMVKKYTGYPAEMNHTDYEAGYERGYKDGTGQTV